MNVFVYQGKSGKMIRNAKKLSKIHNYFCEKEDECYK